MYKTLRGIRITVAVGYLCVLTAAVTLASVGASTIGIWVLDMQIVPAILAGAVAWLIFWILVTISFGRVYCSTVCPLGTIQAAAARLSRVGPKGRKRRYSFTPPANTVRICVASVVGACLFAGIPQVVEYTDPFTIYTRIVKDICYPAAVGSTALAAAIAALIGICAVAWHRGRLLCNTVCPAGALLGMMSRQPVYRVDINTDLCIHCGKCEDVCPSECIDLRDCTVDCSRCVMCLDCTAVCPNGAIIVRRGRHRLSTPMLTSVQ